MEGFLRNGNVSGNDSFPEYAGYIAASISCLCFGTNLLPVKRYEVGDGMMFQWIACVGILVVGLVIHWIRNFPPFYALPMLGGAMWATGNLCVVAIVKTIGLSLGILIWPSFAMFIGWACGRFGWFGLNAEIPLHPTLNYIGVAFAALRGPILFFMKPTDAIESYVDESDEVAVLNSSTSIEVSEEVPGFWDRFTPVQKKVIGCCLSVFSGTMYGFYFTPATYLTDHPALYPGVSTNGLDHVFSLCCGIFLASTAYFLIYCILKRNRPIGIISEALMPAFVSGAMWSIANGGWMVANTTISEAISFPIITTVPSVIASLFGIFYYKEIKGRWNYMLVIASFVSTVTGAVMCGLSKPGSL